MGDLNLSLPSGLTSEDVQALAAASIVGGPGSTPSRTKVTVDSDVLSLSRELEESGHVALPWRVKGAGRLMFSLATLRSRPQPYDLSIELARGKVNQLRNQAAEWERNGLSLSPKVARLISDATRCFTKALSTAGAEQSQQQACSSLALAAEASRELATAYCQHMLQGRNQSRTGPAPTLGCQLSTGLLTGNQSAAFTKTFTSASVSFSPREIVPTEDEFNLDDCDRMVTWASAEGLSLLGGPFFHFAEKEIPPWLQSRAKDRVQLARIVCEYAGQIIGRYGDAISAWQLSVGANLPGAIPLHEDEVLWITLQLADAVQRIAPDAQLVLGISQPWGEYLANEHRLYSPFNFADMLLRRMPAAAINLEVVMGVSPHGSYCRDLLDFSQLLDIYSLLGIPLFVTLGYPALAGDDANADPESSVAAGYWREDMNPQTQSDWAAAYLSMALAKPQVRAVHWIHYSDEDRHQYPNCGLVDANGKARPALKRLRKLRGQHLS